MVFGDILKSNQKFDFNISPFDGQKSRLTMCNQKIFVYTFKTIYDDGKYDRYHYSIKSDCYGKLYAKKCIKQKFLGIKHYKQIWKVEIQNVAEGIEVMIDDCRKIHKGRGHEVVDIKAHTKVNTVYNCDKTYDILCKVHNAWKNTTMRY